MHARVYKKVYKIKSKEDNTVIEDETLETYCCVKCQEQMEWALARQVCYRIATPIILLILVIIAIIVFVTYL